MRRINIEFFSGFVKGFEAKLLKNSVMNADFSVLGVITHWPNR